MQRKIMSNDISNNDITNEYACERKCMSLSPGVKNAGTKLLGLGYSLPATHRMNNFVESE